MKKEIVLSIAMTSVLGLNANLIQAQTTDNTNQQNQTTTTPHPVAKPKAPKEGGKCASGKCGTEKVYGQAKLKANPDGRLVRARDGKCGLTGEGTEVTDNVQQAQTGKCAGGVCGQ